MAAPISQSAVEVLMVRFEVCSIDPAQLAYSLKRLFYQCVKDIA